MAARRLWRFLLLLCMIQVCRGTGRFDFLMKSYSSGCEETFSVCDIRFTFCFDIPRSSPSLSDCAYHTTIESNDYHNTNNIAFDSNIRGILNPIVFDMNNFTDPRVMVVIRLMDENTVVSNNHIITSHNIISFTPAAVASSTQAPYTEGQFTDRGHTYRYKYKAFCNTNYYGSACTTYCVASDSSSKGHYSCNSVGQKVCLKGWQGVNCKDDVDECYTTPNICNSTIAITANTHFPLVCENTIGSYSCSCSAGWKGDNCDQDVNECEMSSVPLCSNGGTCLNLLGSYGCDCPSNWSGPTCTEDVDECITATSPCSLPNTSCNNTIGGYQCTCNAGWMGENCDQDVNECEISSFPLCSYNRICSNTVGSYRCNCPSNWRGPTCTDDVDECVTNTSVCTLPNTHCINTIGGYLCTCDDGWEGQNCTTDIDECLNNNNVNCDNNGSCVNIAGSYSCQCPSGWTGSHCASDVDECDDEPCVDDAECVNLAGNFQCLCANGTSGCLQIPGNTTAVDEDEDKDEFLWWPIVVVVVILVIVVIVVLIFIVRKRKESRMKSTRSRPPSAIEVQSFHPESLKFENILYNANKTSLSSSSDPGPDFRAPMPLPYTSERKSDLFQDDPVVYHDLDEQMALKTSSEQQKGRQPNLEGNAYANGHVALDIRPHAGEENQYEDFNALKHHTERLQTRTGYEDMGGYIMPSPTGSSKQNPEQDQKWNLDGVAKKDHADNHDEGHFNPAFENEEIPEAFPCSETPETDEEQKNYRLSSAAVVPVMRTAVDETDESADQIRPKYPEDNFNNSDRPREIYWAEDEPIFDQNHIQENIEQPVPADEEDEYFAGQPGKFEEYDRDSDDDALDFVGVPHKEETKVDHLDLHSMGETATEDPDYPLPPDHIWQYPEYELARRVAPGTGYF